MVAGCWLRCFCEAREAECPSGNCSAAPNPLTTPLSTTPQHIAVEEVDELNAKLNVAREGGRATQEHDRFRAGHLVLSGLAAHCSHCAHVGGIHRVTEARTHPGFV
jgi:hypothetical protein